MYNLRLIHRVTKLLECNSNLNLDFSKFWHLVCAVISDSLWQWAVACGLLCLWNFLGKNTGAVCYPSSRGSSWPRDQTCVSRVSCIGRQFLYHCTTWKTSYMSLNCVGMNISWSWQQAIHRIRYAIDVTLSLQNILFMSPWHEIKKFHFSFYVTRLPAVGIVVLNHCTWMHFSFTFVL